MEPFCCGGGGGGGGCCCFKLLALGSVILLCSLDGSLNTTLLVAFEDVVDVDCGGLGDTINFRHFRRLSWKTAPLLESTWMPIDLIRPRRYSSNIDVWVKF
jgi:hypothetical protein